MTPTQIYRTFCTFYSDIAKDVLRYQEDNTNTSRIKLIFNDGRKGTFEIKRGKYALEMDAKED